VADGMQPVWHLYVVRSRQRDLLQAQLKSDGIETLIHYPLAPHRQAAYQPLGIAPSSLPIAEQLQQEVLSLPMGPHLQREDVRRVVAAVRRSVAGR
jgi:dTDP-4-amino-4,6-dideoxygalactose transaminase